MEICWSEEEFRQKFDWAFTGDMRIEECDVPKEYPCICYYYAVEAGNCGCIDSRPLNEFIDQRLIDYVKEKEV